MAINPTGGGPNLLNTLQTLTQEIGTLATGTQQPVQQAPTQFVAPQPAPVDLGGGQNGAANILAAVTGVLQALTSLLQLLGIGNAAQPGAGQGQGQGAPAAGGGTAPAAGGGTAPAAGGGTAPAAGGGAAAATATATAQGPASVNLGAKGLPDANAFGIIGGGNKKKFNKAMGELQNAKPVITPAAAGNAAAPGQLQLSAEQVAAIKNAPNDAAAADLVRQFIAGQTGGKGTAITGLDGKMNTKKGADSWQNKKDSREALNQLLGAKIPNGRNKNKSSELMLEQLSTDVARSLRAGAGSTATATASAAAAASSASSSGVPSDSSSGSYGSSSSSSSSASSSASSSSSTTTGAVCVDLSEYRKAADILAEMGTPLIFDLTGTGHIIREAEMIPVELDGDGRLEVVTDLAFGTGLLVFDPRIGGDDLRRFACGAEMFGSGTDLSAYGIEADTDDGCFENGFDALRALAEKFALVGNDKQHLDANDLALLEEKVGLRMRVGGLFGGDVRFADIGLTRIDLGDPEQIQSLDEAQADVFGNKYMRQVGARFTIRGQVRDYVDIFFRIQARVTLDRPAEQLAAAAA